MSVLRRGIDGKPLAPKSGRASTKSASPPPDTASEVSVTDALDALAGLLRTWGAHAIELPERPAKEIRDDCEAWARHLLLATEPPGGAPLAAGKRDWVGLERAFRQLRQQEHGHVTSSQLELRNVIWVCIQALGKASAADERSDCEVAERLQSLRNAAQSAEIVELRDEVTRAVSDLDGHLEARRDRYESQVEALSSELQNMTAALVREKRAGKLDALTKVFCRAAMDEHVEDICQMARVVEPSAIAFLMDIDHFKWVNDKYGHGVGDDLLTRVGAALRQGFRRGGDFVARYGGDEFVGVIEEGNLDAARGIGERVLSLVRDLEVEHEGESIRVGMSIGIAALRRGDSPREWLDRADRALYASKNAGRDRMSVAD